MIGRLPILRLAVLTLALVAASPAAAQPAHLDTWLKVEGPHFTLHTNAGAERGAEIVASLETFRLAFARLAPELELKSPLPTRIFAFAEAGSYAPYKSEADERGVKILGQFLSHRDGNYLTLNADPRFLGSFAVIFHEYVHYLVQHNFPGVPRWFNEGLAEYYSTFAIEGGAAVIGRPVERHLRWLDRNAELELDEVLARDRSSAGFNEAQKAGRFYAVSWGLVHYLLSAGDEGAARLADILAPRDRDADPLRALEDALGMRQREIEQELARYLVAASMPVARLRLDRLGAAAEVRSTAARPAEVLVGLGDLLAHMGRETAAQRHFDLALEYEPRNPEAHAGLGYVLDRQDRLVEAETLYRQAVDLGSTSALTYLLYGRHLLRAAQSGGLSGNGSGVEELARGARDAFRIAVELNPGFAEPRAMLGAVHLLRGLSPEEGIAHLERASAALPGRADLHFQLVQLYVRAERMDAARALAAGELAAVASAEQLAAAEEEIERWTLIHAANAAFAEGDREAGIRLLDRAISLTSDAEMRMRMEERLIALLQIEGR